MRRAASFRAAARSVLALAALALSVPPASAAAQRPHRSGLWAEIGNGPAHLRVACSGCADVTRVGASAGYVRVGGALSDRVLLGVESYNLLGDTFGFGGDSLEARNSSLAAVVLWYPWRSGVFLKGGAGGAGGALWLKPASDQPIHAEGIGVGMTFGVGLDVPISRRFALTGNAGAWITAIGDVVLPAKRVDDVIATLYSATIGVTIR